MNEHSRHVISRLKWDTAFDKKEQAVALQERLSDWSGFLMQKEINAVFDQLCPPEQTWRIQLMELDLGIIDFHNLEEELSAKLRQQLNEKLTEMILYSHQHGKYIEILDEKKSAIELISYFLTHGLLPWSYQLADGSINQILAAQLQNNAEKLIDRLKELGFSAEQVRKRMAWQFNETNMIRIIEGIEPNVSDQIILFLRELTKVQQKETVVQASSSTDFKKNLWLWVLNFLLTERGTVFNRVQFMKSSILQMAAHYNMHYDHLFELIELAVDKLNSSLSLQPNFMTTLQLLSKENKYYKKKIGAITSNASSNLNHLIPSKPVVVQKKPVVKPKAILLSKHLTMPLKEKHPLQQGGVSVRNAGIVLINTYLSILLTRLELLTEHKKFISEDAQLSAVHYMQYVVTGANGSEESLLPLNKLLCGIPLSQPVKESAGITDAHKTLIDGLITAVIDHWPSIGKCTVDGFRGNWLVRDGLLIEKEDRWELTVDKRVYDLLIHKSPFSFSVIRYPWMKKPLYVNWSY